MKSLHLMVYKTAGIRCRLRNGLSIKTRMNDRLYKAHLYERRTGLPRRRFLQEQIGRIHCYFDHSTARESDWKNAAARLEPKMGYMFEFSSENF